MEYKFSGKNKEECLSKAEKELSVAKSDINYKVLVETKSLFKSRCEILVIVNNEEVIEERKEEVIVKDEVKVKDDKIIISGKDAETFILDFEDGIQIMVNGNSVSNFTKVNPMDEIRFRCDNEKARRELNIDIKDNMEARISIHYVPEIILNVKCKKTFDKISIKKEFNEGQYPPKYNKDEIIDALRNKGIVYGIQEEEISKVLIKNTVTCELVAKGLECINDEDDKITVFFEGQRRNVSEDSFEKVDYRNVYSIANVAAGDLIGELIIGKDGKDGINLFGAPIKRKLRKTINLKVGEGCKMEDTKVFSIIAGRPTIKNGIFYVHKMLETTTDIDIKSGNINFIGDVKISGNVKEGMVVEAGNSVELSGNMEGSKIIAQGEVRIGGSVIRSKVNAGAKDLDKQFYLDNLKKFKENLNQLIASVNQIKERSLLGRGRSDGEIIKILIETKFKDMPRIGTMLISMVNSLGEHNENLTYFIRHKILGNGPLNIKYSNELYDLLKYLDSEISPLMEQVIIPIDVYVGYGQDSNIQATGNIFISGKGLYTSELLCNGGVEFLTSGSVVRGGKIKACKYIKAKVVGSNGGVTTTLSVPKDGIITADIAYQNTIFSFGDRQFMLETASREVKAYLDESGEVVVDKFVL